MVNQSLIRAPRKSTRCIDTTPGRTHVIVNTIDNCPFEARMALAKVYCFATGRYNTIPGRCIALCITLN